MRFITLLTALLLILSSAPAHADNTILAAGAGYKAYVTELAGAYTAESGKTLDLIFGNMGRVIAQAKAGGKADIVLGAEWFFKKAEMDTSSAAVLGEGKAVLAWSKQAKAKGPEDLKTHPDARIALPDPKRAIYGRAAMQYLKNTGLYDQLKEQLLITGTVPQVGTYLMSGEADFGFINLTHAKKIADKIGGFITLEKDYDPIRIIALSTGLSGPEKTGSFFEFLKTDTAKAIAKKHGL